MRERKLRKKGKRERVCERAGKAEGGHATSSMVSHVCNFPFTRSRKTISV